MDLWPEFMFETQFPYYTSDSIGMYTDSSEYTGAVTGKEKWLKEEQRWNRSDVDAEHRKLAMGNGLLLTSHKKMRQHRSWWTCYFPHNLFVPHKLYSAMFDSNLDDYTNYYHHGYILNNNY